MMAWREAVTVGGRVGLTGTGVRLGVSVGVTVASGGTRACTSDRRARSKDCGLVTKTVARPPTIARTLMINSSVAALRFWRGCMRWK